MGQARPPVIMRLSKPMTRPDHRALPARRGDGEGLADGARRTGSDGRQRPGPGRAGAWRWRAGLPGVWGCAGPVGLGAGPVAAWPWRGVAAPSPASGPLSGLRATHVLLPVSGLLRRVDLAEVIG